jgi:FlaA1/EpsC-like NDP-sugar epimerase
MILKVFNQYIPFRKLVFFFFETFFIFGMVILGTYIRFFGEIGGFEVYEGLFLKTLAIVAAVQLSLYYFDLYDLKIYRSNIELGIRLLQSLGVSSILLAVPYYLFPSLIIGQGIFFISLGFMAAVIVSWRMTYNYILRSRQLDQRILIIGTGVLARDIAKEIVDRVDTGFKIIGFIAENPEEVGKKLVNPSIISDTSQITDIVRREKVDRIIVALADRREKFPG